MHRESVINDYDDTIDDDGWYDDDDDDDRTRRWKGLQIIDSNNVWKQWLIINTNYKNLNDNDNISYKAVPLLLWRDSELIAGMQSLMMDLI